MTDVFDRIYRGNLWRGTESLSGPGSGFAATTRISYEVLGLAAELGVTSVLDVGCGDSYWMPELPGYVGIDVSAVAITRAWTSYPDRDYRLVSVWDLDPVPFDLVILRDVIQHCSFRDGLLTVDGIRATSSRYLLASTFTDGANLDIVTGDAYRPDMSDAPFDLGRPEQLIFDGYGYTDPDAIRDPGKHLGLWKL